MKEDKEFICTARGEPCQCNKEGCITKRDPLDRIAEALEDVVIQLKVRNIYENPSTD